MKCAVMRKCFELAKEMSQPILKMHVRNSFMVAKPIAEEEAERCHKLHRIPHAKIKIFANNRHNEICKITFSESDAQFHQRGYASENLCGKCAQLRAQRHYIHIASNQICHDKCNC